MAMSRSESIVYDHILLHPSIDAASSSSSFIPSYVSLPRQAKIKSLQMHPTSEGNPHQSHTSDVKEFETTNIINSNLTSGINGDSSKKFPPSLQSLTRRRSTSSEETHQQLLSSSQTNNISRSHALKTSVLKSFDKILYYDDDRSRVWNSLSSEATTSSDPSSLVDLPSNITSMSVTTSSRLHHAPRDSRESSMDENALHPSCNPSVVNDDREAVSSHTSCDSSPEKYTEVSKVPMTPDNNSPSKESRSSTSSLFNQLKAWTSDRKHIRSRLKKITNKYKYSLGKQESPPITTSVEGASSSPASSGSRADSCVNFKETISTEDNKRKSTPTTTSSSSSNKSQSHVKRTNSSVSSVSSSPSVGVSSSWKRLSILTFPSFSGHHNNRSSRNLPATASSQHQESDKICEDSCDENSSSQASSSSTRDSGISPDSSSQLDSELEHIDPPSSSWPIMFPSSNKVGEISVSDSKTPTSCSSSRLLPPSSICPSSSSSSGVNHQETQDRSQAENHSLNSRFNPAVHCVTDELIPRQKLHKRGSEETFVIPSSVSLTTSPFEETSVLEMSLTKDSRGELGIYVTGKLDTANEIMRYIIADFEADGPASKNGVLKRGDEVLAVNHKSLRGLSLENALKLLRTNDTTVHLRVSRQKECSALIAEVEGAPLSLESLTISSSRSSSSTGPSLQLPLLVSSDPVTTALSSQLKAVEEQVQAIHSVSPDVTPNNKTQDSGRKDTIKSELNQKTTDQDSDLMSGFFTTPRKSSRLNNNKLIHHGAAFFEKGPGKKPLGFSIIGGSDCGHIDKAIYVKTIYPKGQSYEMDCLKEGDEILSINGQPLEGKSHDEVLALFKQVKVGTICVEFVRRQPPPAKRSRSKDSRTTAGSFQSCSQLDLIK